ncbi:MAG TPA: amidohydrolase family protein [Dokdonella sp.]|uniref:amidohydrolase family protein n=1 Tax=Dokdonella sp. TaxID=2291710 RepID=UPI002D7EB1C6|nr:amidohydrolase family protein [Dokdonella sp.]HET9031323.1 amidohydrolase family protein [Dokdonella sp.]
MKLLIQGLLVLLTGVGSAHAAEHIEKSVMLLAGANAGFQQANYSDDGTLAVHFEFNDRGRGPKLDSTFSFDSNGVPNAIELKGVDYLKAPVEESFQRTGDTVAWKNASEDEKRTLSKPAFFIGLNQVPEVSALLARALLAAAEHKLPLLPAGEASIRKLASVEVKGTTDSRTVDLYAINGLDLLPSYIWLDQDQRFFAAWSGWSTIVRDGFEGAVDTIGERQQQEEKRLAEIRANELTRKLSSPLLIRNVRVFDPPSGEVVDDRAVLIDDGKIVSIGSADVSPLEGVEELDGAGRFLMPGLWDMHVHFTGGADGLLDLASGVTTVRDMANQVDTLQGLIDGIEAGRDIGPRIIRAGIIDGKGPFAGPTKVLVDTEQEALDAVAMYKATGHEQIKIYSSVKPELMPIIAKAAHDQGMRVSGHVPAFMTARQFVENGADEIQHINMLFLNFMFDKVQDTRTPARFTAVAEYGAALDLSSPPVRDFIQLLKDKHIVIDPTVGTFEDMFLSRPGVPGPGFAAIVDRFPSAWQRQMKSGAGGLEMKPGQQALFRDSYQNMVNMVGVLYRSGIHIVAGTDNLAGMTLPREFELYVEAGIPPMDVLRIATSGAAQVMKRENDYGRIAPGYVSDLILVDGDPTINMADIRKVRTTIRGDRLYDADALFKAVSIAPAK